MSMSENNQVIKQLQSGSLRVIIFDFDGTLLDIKEIIEKSINETLGKENMNIDLEITLQ